MALKEPEAVIVAIPDELRILLKFLHRNAVEPEDQSIRNGTQLNLGLLDNYKVLRLFVRDLRQIITNLLGDQLEFAGIWSNSLNHGGFHVKHIHPKGWVSGVCYIDVPDDTSGLLKIYAQTPQTITPEVGKCVLFPSNLPHEVTTYQGSTPRLSIAFDLRKL